MYLISFTRISTLAMTTFDMFFDQLPVCKINGCHYFGPCQEDATFSPICNSELLVARIPKSFSPKELIKIFFTAGPVYDVRLPATFMKKNNGIAFVRYSNPEMAKRAIHYINRHQLPMTNRHLLATLSTDYRTLLLTGCSPSVTREEVEHFFGYTERAELISVTKEVEAIRDSSKFYLLFASHGSAAIMEKSNWESRLNGRWGYEVNLYWCPYNEEDLEKIWNINSSHSILYSLLSTKPGKILKAMETYSKLMLIYGATRPFDRQNLHQKLDNLLSSIRQSQPVDLNPFTSSMSRESSQNNWTTGNSASNQNSFSLWSDSVWGVSPLDFNQRATGNPLKHCVFGDSSANQEAPSSESAGALGGSSALFQNDQKGNTSSQWILEGFSANQEASSSVSAGAWAVSSSLSQND